MSSAAHGALDMGEQCLSSFVAARGLLERGMLGLDGTPSSAIAAVILYDAAVETAAKATLRASPSPTVFPGTGYVIPSAKRAVQQKEHLPWVLDQLLASYRELRADDQVEWPALRDARALHDYRNTVHHQGTVPSPEDLERQRFRATDFLRSLASSFFGRQLAELSRAMLVQDKQIRVAIQVAERRLAKGDLTFAVEVLSMAFELARFAFRSGQPYDSRKSIDGFAVKSAINEIRHACQVPGTKKVLSETRFRDLEDLLEALVCRSEWAEDHLEALSLGAQASDYAWFRHRFPLAYTYAGMDGEDLWDVSWPADRSERRFTREEVIRGLQFVTTVALHWQQCSAAPEPNEGPHAEPDDGSRS